MSNIGGTLGLWLGFSLMTSFEFLEFVVDLLVHACDRRRSRRTGTSRPPARAVSRNDVIIEDADDLTPDTPPPAYTSRVDVSR